jgi:hypothetical protein
LIVISFCAKCGKEHTDEDLFCSQCGASLKERGDAITEVIELDYPESDDPLLELSIPVSGRLEIHPGGDRLVDGTISYDIPEWKPFISASSDRILVKQEERWLHTHWDSPQNDWDLKIGTVKPFQFKVRTGVSRAKLSLGGVPLTRLNLNTGVGTCKVWFNDENPESMQLLKVQSGVGQTDVQDILNANPREVKISGGVGEVRLGFTGKKPEQDIHARIEGGVGSFEISISEDVPAVIRVNGLTGVDLRGKIRTTRRSFGSGVYETESYSEGGPALDIRVSFGIGGLTLRTV